MTVQRVRNALVRRWHWIPMALLTVVTLFPLLWGVSSSLKSRYEVYQTPPGLFPAVPQFLNYVEVFQYSNFGWFFFNSAFLAVSSTLLATVVSVLAAYAFARFRFALSTLAFFAIIIPRIIPRSSLIVPLYRVAVSVGLVDSYVGLVIAYTAISIPLSTWILTGFFKGVPKDMEDSALIDGASRMQTIWHIVVPMAVPALVTVVIFALRQAWNELPFILALTSRTRMRTLQYQLLSLQDQIGVVNWPVILAFTVITIVPLVLTYLVFQRRVVSSLISGAIK